MFLPLLTRWNRNERPAPPTDNDLQRARKELALAWQQFDQAEPAFIDAAILRLAAAEQTYCALLKERKISHERRNSLEIVQ
ncbi:hypothetical protein KDJ56_11040 [Brevibacillus composti]|uniref:DUF2508 family protein n=1 Tax=Brevibacillus composti TaxID=2796470 RepID=A0ABX7Z8W5_9BACL|nr:hypothetical protein [Brevibacillus composti]QUO43436.1 hypothetical protein KDJ56_11040 [Brevibacillus composti]